MSRLSDKISYLQGLAEGLKLNKEDDTNRLLLSMLDTIRELGDAYEALAESHGELSSYVDSIDEDLSDLEDIVYDDEENNEGDEDEEDDEDDEDEEGPSGAAFGSSQILYECPHCHTTIEIDPDSPDFDEKALCPACHKELFPETLDK